MSGQFFLHLTTTFHCLRPDQIWVKEITDGKIIYLVMKLHRKKNHPPCRSVLTNSTVSGNIARQKECVESTLETKGDTNLPNKIVFLFSLLVFSNCHNKFKCCFYNF